MEVPSWPSTQRQGILLGLQNNAQALRRLYDELQEGLGHGRVTGALAEFADLAAARDEAHARLSAAVGALETIRLNLLRLHAGSMSVEGLTTHLSIAARVSEQVERLIAAHGDIERELERGRAATPTPA